MKLYNKSTNGLQHGEHKLPVGGVADIPDEIAKKWLEFKGVEKYVTPADFEKAAKQAKAKAEAELKALKDENAELRKLKLSNHNVLVNIGEITDDTKYL